MSDLKGDKSSHASDNDIFHSITMAEQSVWSKGFLEGQQEGRKRHFQDGFRLGAEKGVELGREVGFYAGYASRIQKLYEDDHSKSRFHDIEKRKKDGSGY